MPTKPQPVKQGSTLVAPAVALGLALVVMLVVNLVVLPRLETFFDSFHAKLPLPTRMLLAFSHFMNPAGWLILAIIVCSILAAVDYFWTPNGRATKDQLLLRLPAASDLLEHDIAERFKRYFGPVVIVFVGVFLGLVVIALVSAICSVYNQVNI